MEDNIVKIRGPWIKGIISKGLMNILKKMGYDVKINLYSLDATSDDVTVKLRGDIEIEAPLELLTKLVDKE